MVNGELDHRGAATSRFVQMLQHVAHLGVFGREATESDRQTGRQPRLAKVVDGIAQALHGEFDIVRLKVSPTFKSRSNE
jgi:hypothetical protein